jgi:hypothetical protein
MVPRLEVDAEEVDPTVVEVLPVFFPVTPVFDPVEPVFVFPVPPEWTTPVSDPIPWSVPESIGVVGTEIWLLASMVPATSVVNDTCERHTGAFGNAESIVMVTGKVPLMVAVVSTWMRSEPSGWKRRVI